MARLTDLPPARAKRYAELECPGFETRPWISGPPLSRRRVAIGSVATTHYSLMGAADPVQMEEHARRTAPKAHVAAE